MQKHSRIGNMHIFLLIWGYLCVAVVTAAAQNLPIAAPQTLGMNAAKLAQIDAVVEADIKDKKLPGAVVLIGHKGKIVFRKAYGNRSLVPTVEKMTVDTIFDMASLTKPVATATSIMILMERGKVRLNDTIGKFIPDIEDEQAQRVTVLQLLTHVSGYAPDFDLKEKWVGREGMLTALKKEKLRTPPGTRFVYSDIGFVVLGEIVERVSGRTLDVFAKENHFAGMSDTTIVRDSLDSRVPNASASRLNLLSRTAPTEDVCGQQSYLGSTPSADCQRLKQILRGTVHDPTSYRMHGVAGHAGLFSTADDIARFSQMMLNNGVMDGKRILSAQTIARMTAPYVVAEDGSARGLGWDINTSFSSNRGELFPLGSFGHTGFTGTSVWIDRVSQTFVVFLSNRVHPDGKGDVTPLRAKVATIAASAIEDLPMERWNEAEAPYNAAVAAQIPKFREQVEAARRAMTGTQATPPATTRSGVPPLAGGTPAVQSVTVLNGIDILERDKFKQLDRMRIGLVTNHTGRNLAGKPTIDILKEAPNVKLVSLFAPEHGIRGLLDDKVSDSEDQKTGLPIYSLYGETRRPKPEQIRDLDAIVYDIQDIGARFYTYTATLRNVMEEAAKLGKPVFVLDRPNPINGVAVEGPLADEDKLSFIAAHTTPVRYGLTIGELGQMMNAERKMGADLRVVKMDGWSRAMWFDETGQTWVNPSPNMRSLT
ncbi:MAG: exo-beta-N-acetylmuramidase NamZ domain-containing protein, partial [Pyrinomonadaceae bacterium]